MSANTSTPRTVLQLDNIYDDTTENPLGYSVKSSIVSGNGFESTSSFSALPLQPVPRAAANGPVERTGFFMSGPLERGAVSDPEGRVHFSAPLGGFYVKKKREKSISGILRNFSEKKRPWVVPVLNFVGRRDNSEDTEATVAEEEKSGGDVQWALGKAGEDRVHVVISEEQGWLFVGIYDGFNGPDAPEFLMGNLHRAVFHELHGLFWEFDEETETNPPNILIDTGSLNKTDSETQNQNSSIEEVKNAGQGLLWNDALLEMFRNEYIGTAPYISCSPSLRHHRICPRDQFLILSSDGLYQYLSSQEVVSLVESFMEKFPDGDPAQHLIEEVLMHAAKKAGMDFHELLDIPQGDRRKYHDDVTVMVISLEGRIWKSSGKYV